MDSMKKMIQSVIKLLLVVVSLGILMIWILTPTRLHRKQWVPKIRARANTTYFGTQGANILEYTFPMLFIAVLACIYLHLKKKGEKDNEERKKEEKGVSSWNRPALVKGPLGVVTWTELAFMGMFVALWVWSFGTYLHIGIKDIKAKHGEKLWEARLDGAALRIGFLGNLCLAFLFYPVTRGSSVLHLIGLTSESSIKYHIWLGHIVMTLFTVHGLCYIVFWASMDELSQMVKWEKVGVSNIAGELALLCGLAMWATTFPKIRRQMFELFFYTHYLYILFVMFYVFHVGVGYSVIMLPGLYLFLIDRYLRFLQSRQSVRLLSSRLLPCETVELNFSKTTDLVYSTTSIMFINVPSISKLQWHPFTITSSSNLEPEKLSIMIKKEGSWSQKLYQILSTPSSVERLEVAVEGPYGPSSTNFLKHETLVMVSGGSGITPFFSIIRELIFISNAMNKKMPKILLVCAFKTSADLTMLDLLLPISGTPSSISQLQLQIEAYVTREKQQNMNEKNLIRTIWFKPNASDKPISGILGQNYWLWLGVIISCSFVLFLILLGVITRYYIYPIDHNTNKIYSSGSRAAINMLIICISVGLVASLAVLKNKNRNAMEGKQIRNTEAQTPTTSPGGSWNHNPDRELESLPGQSLVEATSVHYGSRPDLKKVLFDIEGSSVGVMVSGPKQMRHEVATICGSGLADNLEFESISFSW